MSNLIIRQETAADHTRVFEIVETAFKTMPYSDHREQFLVERLRKTDAFVPELSLVAEMDGKVIGHILFTKLAVKNEEDLFLGLGLAPVSVDPDFQNQGIGGQLIKAGHQVAQELGFQFVLLIGHEAYYPRFGYEMAQNYGIRFPFEVPAPNAMAMALNEQGLKKVQGEVVYHPTFFE